MEKTNTTVWDKIINYIFLLTFILAIGVSFYKYYYTRNYDYVVEATCNPAIEKCFYRDCTNPDDCPPNALSDYRQFQIKAYDFQKCSDNSCLAECLSGKIKCEEQTCGDTPDDECSEIPTSEDTTNLSPTSTESI